MVEKNINTREHWDDRWTNSPGFSRQCEKAICSLVDPNTSVLDIGCGNGRILRGLKKDKNCKVYGMDISQVAINNLRKREIKGLCVDVSDYSDKTPYDVIVLSHTLEHINDDTALVKKLALNVKKYLIVAVPNNCMPPEEEPEHLRTYTKESLTTLLSKHFKKIEDHSVGIHLILKAYA